VAYRHKFNFSTEALQKAILATWPLHNCWLGFSAENQEMFEERWAEMEPLARKGWLVWCSYEPALGPIDMSKALAAGLRWVVTGGESGPGARPFDIQWARDIISQCKAACVPCFVKQLGAKPIEKTYTLAPWKNGACGEPGDWSPILLDRKGGDCSEWDESLRVREFPS
jgi:protein gp37